MYTPSKNKNVTVVDRVHIKTMQASYANFIAFKDSHIVSDDVKTKIRYISAISIFIK